MIKVHMLGVINVFDKNIFHMETFPLILKVITFTLCNGIQ